MLVMLKINSWPALRPRERLMPAMGKWQQHDLDLFRHPVARGWMVIVNDSVVDREKGRGRESAGHGFASKPSSDQQVLPFPILPSEEIVNRLIVRIKHHGIIW